MPARERQVRLVGYVKARGASTRGKGNRVKPVEPQRAEQLQQRDKRLSVTDGCREARLGRRLRAGDGDALRDDTDVLSEAMNLAIPVPVSPYTVDRASG